MHDSVLTTVNSIKNRNKETVMSNRYQIYRFKLAIQIEDLYVIKPMFLNKPV